MSDGDSLLSRWPLIAATLLLSLAFAWVFIASIERAVSARSAELTLETGNNTNAVQGRGMTLTPSLSTLPETTAERRKPVEPAPWWPALLFALAFLCGWGFRHALKERALQPLVVTHAEKSESPQPDTTQSAVQTPDEDTLRRPAPVNETMPDADESHQLNVKTIKLASGPDLTRDFPWDESVIGDMAGLSSDERIARLEKQNASKAEIIKALERLVTENREKWLHQDETEARLNQHIQELSDDLRVAVRQLQDLQADAPAPLVTGRKNTG